jgi:ABC-2 type transport system permease protein
VHLLQAWRRLKSVRQESRLLTTIIVAFMVGYVTLSYWLFFAALRFVARFVGFGAVLTERLMYILFAFLFGLLLLSNLVISYTNFFRNREASFLLTLPVPRATIFRWKFIESTLLASWAFLFLIAPFLAAFGQMRGAEWHFYGVTVLLIAVFIILPGIIGSWLAIQIARYLDRRSFQRMVVALACVVIALAAWWWRTPLAPDDVVDTRVLTMLDQVLAKTRIAEFPFLPSYWLSASVLQWADGAITSAVFFGLVLLSHALFFGTLAFTRLGNVFYDSASAVQSRGNSPRRWLGWFRRRRAGDGSIGALEKIAGMLPFVGADVRALLVKDARMFWRDTAQWGQSVMLFGLLAVYILNLRHFTRQLSNPFWINLVAHLNLGACALNLATLTTRFVYPQFSLEGKRLWIVGIAPLGLRRIVLIKYWMASAASLIITLTLILLSCYLLKMRWVQIAYFGALVAVMTFALNGLAVGLGVLYPNFKETHPSKIVSGFGGTLCLVLSFLYILASVLVVGVGTAGLRAQTGSTVISLTLFLLMSIGVGWVPLRMGLKQLNRFEF